MKSMPRKLGIFIAFVVVLFLIYGLWSLIFARDPFVPAEFIEASRESALIASQIVTFSSESSENISKINELDKQHRYSEAIVLVAEEIKRNEELKQKAYELSLQLGNMAGVLPSIRPKEATEIALEALNYETTIVLSLISYSDSLNDLLVALDDKFNNRKEFSPGRVQEMIEKINSEAESINGLNEKYKESINEFEKIVME
ncbi:MAG: hypothetical protein COV57_01365 [Candidatus Liptonbacteria bacterium CG11_big_fil_rev_8_21_14_0_20_35_14]|uniref:DUF5667 domain-containing protein n=1 Tax=Candidatus Liptonbacteria bacterium CG11_big_fil_rev_8_21_14_0_20_35_14 TaxID=1974634 RepID=A0A2H0N803_9BACT|nr:MAG: hypothetical protein COV57_01365 [Candidatus Liptonbacteria bacterium CG11_big_fil_rev_8_21_14_0_20_35_14]